MELARRPRIYETEQDIRFGDLDPYGHLNAKHFLDLVASSRFTYISNHLNVSVENILERGYAFYLRKATQHFKQPVVGVQKLWVKSYVSEIRDSQILVEFEVRDASRKALHAGGTLEYVVVDVKTKRPATTPAWLLELFYLDGTGTTACESTRTESDPSPPPPPGA